MTDNNEDDYEPEDTAEGMTDEEDDFVPLDEVDDCDDIELETPECEFDNHTTAVFRSGDPENYPKIAGLMVDVNEHGEVHATVEEHEKELEIRKGTVTLDFGKGLIRFHETPNGTRNIVSMDRIVDWYRPMSVWH